MSGTLDFNTADGLLGAVVHDGEAGAADLGAAGGTYAIFAADAAGAANGHNLMYLADLGVGRDGVASDSTTDNRLVLKSVAGGEFSLEGIELIDPLVNQNRATLEGFRDGVSTGSVTVTLGGSHFRLLGGADLSSTIFGNVDEVRISNPDGATVSLGLDDVTIGAAVTPAAPQPDPDPGPGPLVLIGAGGLNGTLVQTFQNNVTVFVSTFFGDGGAGATPRTGSVTMVGQGLLTGQLSGNLGMTVTEGAATKFSNDPLASLTNLLRGDGSSPYDHMLDSLNQQMSTLMSQAPGATSVPVITQSLQLTSSPLSPLAGALALTGAAPGQALTVLAIDARFLLRPPNLQLNNVDVALIQGPATITGGAGRQLVIGDYNSQSMILGADDDELHGGGGADTVGSAGGNDRLFGDDGDDLVFGGEGDDVVQGNAGADTVSGGVGDDLVLGGRDNDRLAGDDGDDRVFGDLGDDRMDGGAGRDVLQGGEGADTVLGGAGDDVIRGGRGDDVLVGGDGADWLSGDLGADTMTGGAGADVFHTFAGAGSDRVTDFNAAEGDRVSLLHGQAYSLSQVGADTVVDLGGGDRLVLAGVQLSTLQAGWIFVG